MSRDNQPLVVRSMCLWDKGLMVPVKTVKYDLLSSERQERTWTLPMNVQSSAIVFDDERQKKRSRRR